jgi:GntR family transcriptional regulator
MVIGSRGISDASPMPKYTQLSHILQDLVETELGLDELLPSEREISERFGIARMTVRQAVDQLVAEVRVYKVPGKGTFVARPRLVMPLRLTSFTADMRAGGMRPGAVELSRREIPANAELSRLLGVGPDEPVHVLERLRLADDEPIAVGRSHLVARRTPGLLDEPLDDLSLYALLEKRYGLVIDGGEQTIGAGLASSSDASALQVRPGAEVLRFERWSLAGGAPLEYATSTYRGGPVPAAGLVRPFRPPSSQPGLGAGLTPPGVQNLRARSYRHLVSTPPLLACGPGRRCVAELDDVTVRAERRVAPERGGGMPQEEFRVVRRREPRRPVGRPEQPVEHQAASGQGETENPTVTGQPTDRHRRHHQVRVVGTRPRPTRHPPLLGAVQPRDQRRVHVQGGEAVVLRVPLPRSLVPARACLGVVGPGTAPQVQRQHTGDQLVPRIRPAPAANHRRSSGGPDGRETEDRHGVTCPGFGPDELPPGPAHNGERTCHASRPPLTSRRSRGSFPAPHSTASWRLTLTRHRSRSVGSGVPRRGPGGSRRGRLAAVRLLLHPSLHWTDQRGATVRGRRTVLAVLQQTGPPDLPAAVELRDGQVYRWRS